ncbi:MAG: hypothetical protein OJF52_002185 [Nitrospira sp.]|nr:MAG: hypothetical protein OJF52_002185 [Nitrospira sp.]
MPEDKSPIPRKLVKRREYLIPGIGWKPLDEFFRRAWPKPFQLLKKGRSNFARGRHTIPPKQCCCTDLHNGIRNASLLSTP